MELLVHLPVFDGTGKKMIRLIQRLGLLNRTRVFSSHEDLIHRLCLPKDPMTLVILGGASRADLIALTALRPMLRGIRVVLVLKENSEETLALGHTYLPRLILNGEDDLSELAAMLINLSCGAASQRTGPSREGPGAANEACLQTKEA